MVTDKSVNMEVTVNSTLVQYCQREWGRGGGIGVIYYESLSIGCTTGDFRPGIGQSSIKLPRTLSHTPSPGFCVSLTESAQWLCTRLLCHCARPGTVTELPCWAIPSDLLILLWLCCSLICADRANETLCRLVDAWPPFTCTAFDLLVNRQNLRVILENNP